MKSFTLLYTIFMIKDILFYRKEGVKPMKTNPTRITSGFVKKDAIFTFPYSHLVARKEMTRTVYDLKKDDRLVHVHAGDKVTIYEEEYEDNFKGPRYTFSYGGVERRFYFPDNEDVMNPEYADLVDFLRNNIAWSANLVLSSTVTIPKILEDQIKIVRM